MVSADLMEHRALTKATGEALDGWWAQRPAGSPLPTLADLGWGDLALLAPLLQRLPLRSYTEVDLTPEVLPLAQAALSPVPHPTRWQQDDLLAWIQADGPKMHLTHSAFAIHYLSSCDIPADRTAIAARAEAAGWRWTGPGTVSTTLKHWRC